MMASLWTGWALAFLLGARHASEPDHLVAVSTLVAERPGRVGSVWLGALWGTGHTLSLLVVGGGLLLLRLSMPTALADLLELGVSVMLLVLGARSLQRAYRAGRSDHAKTHVHGPHQHLHSGPTDHVHVAGWPLARRPLFVGLVHGMAGSGALTALALANMPSLVPALIYMLLFGLGSIGSMALVTGAAAWPLRRMAQSARVQLILNAAAGITSLVLGVLWGWPLIWKLTPG